MFKKLALSVVLIGVPLTPPVNTLLLSDPPPVKLQVQLEKWPVLSTSTPDFDTDVMQPLEAHRARVRAEEAKVAIKAQERANVRQTAPEQAREPIEEKPPVQQDVWTILADCETGDGQVGPPYSAVANYNGPSGFHGAFQFLPSTWSKLGTGYTFAWQAPYEVQKAHAQKLQAVAGWGQWPSCTNRMKQKGYI